MAGTKTNERPGTRRRTSAARPTRPVRFSISSGASRTPRPPRSSSSPSEAVSEDAKVLDSAVANAEHNDNQVAEELYVYADEGPTSLAPPCSWPCIVSASAPATSRSSSRYDDEALEALRNREAAAGRSGSSQAAEARRRVAHQGPTAGS